MKRQTVESSNIKSIGYDAKSQVLEIEFTSGSIYQYRNVPASLHSRLMSAESHGQFFNTAIKSNPAEYPYRKVK